LSSLIYSSEIEVAGVTSILPDAHPVSDLICIRRDGNLQGNYCSFSEQENRKNTELITIIFNIIKL
jgi:hypothetical protein